MKKSALFLLGASLTGASLVGCTSDAPCDPNEANSICTIAGHSITTGYGGDGELAIDADIYIPLDSTIAPNGDVWFIDFNNYVIRQIDPEGIITTVEGNSFLGDSPASDGLTSVPALDAYNNHTTGLEFGPDGNLYLAAWHESRVKMVDMADMTMWNYAGAGVRTKYTGDGGAAMDADVDLPSSIAFDPNGNLVLMDQGNQVIRMVDAASGTISTIAGHCVIDDAAQCAPGVDPVACPGSDKVTCGDPTATCGNACTPGFAGDGGPALLARFAEPYGQASDPSGRIAYDNVGNLIISDTANNRLRMVDTNGIVSTIAGTGDADYSGDGGPATEAALNHPVDLAIAPDNSIYFTDVENNCVRKISPTGTISSVVGKCSSHVADRGFSGDGGPPLEAQLDRPYGIDLEGDKLYVSDSYNNRLRVVNLPTE